MHCITKYQIFLFFFICTTRNENDINIQRQMHFIGNINWNFKKTSFLVSWTCFFAVLRVIELSFYCSFQSIENINSACGLHTTQVNKKKLFYVRTLNFFFTEIQRKANGLASMDFQLVFTNYFLPSETHDYLVNNLENLKNPAYRETLLYD